MKLNKYSPIAFVYFFVNGVGLPFGLLYTTVFAPFLYLWLLVKGQRYVIVKFLLVFTPFAVIHYLDGIVIKDYVRSTLLLFITYVFTYAFYVFVNSYRQLEKLFRQLLIANFIMTLLAIVFYFTPWREAFWWVKKLTEGLPDFPRLAMFTYEPSYYSTLLVPIVFYYMLRIFFRQIQQGKWAIILMLFLPLLLSFSLGVIGAMLLSFIVMLLFNSKGFVYRKKVFYSLLGVAGALLITFVILLVWYPDNPLFIRLSNINEGMDTSARGRTREAFQLAWIVAEIKSIWWGIGPGQMKTTGYEAIISFYNYQRVEFPVVRIPNAFAETIAVFGLMGAGLRLFAEVYLFFRTKVWTNYFRFMLFFYIFIYQFTGSFITNIAEYVIWALAFSNVFPQFNRENVSRPLPPRPMPLAGQQA